MLSILTNRTSGNENMAGIGMNLKMPFSFQKLKNKVSCLFTYEVAVE